MNTIHIFEKETEIIDGKKFDICPGDKVILKAPVFLLENIKGTSKNMVRVKVSRRLGWMLSQRNCNHVQVTYIP